MTRNISALGAALLASFALGCGFSTSGAPRDASGGEPGTADADLDARADAARVEPDAAIELPPDAPASPGVCGALCVAAGGTCDDNICKFACNGNACPDQVVCPPGIPCEVRCSSEFLQPACPNGVACGDATSCVVACDGAACGGGVFCGDSGACAVACSGASCAGGVECGAAACDVTCSGASCASVDCQDSCACAVSCDGSSCLAGGVTCTAAACETSGGCRTTPTSCNTCP